MAKGARRGGRVRDKWRDKQWLIVNSPFAFGSNQLNYIPITDADTAKGRVIENTMYDIKKQDLSQHQTKIFVEINKISQGTASTVYKGHEYGKEFLRSLIRRGSSMVNYVNDYQTSDGYKFRITIVAFSQKRLNSSKKHAIRLMTYQLLMERIPKLTIDQFIDEVTDNKGSISLELLASGRKIASLRHIGIKKTKMLFSPKLEEAKAIEIEETENPENIKEE